MVVDAAAFDIQPGGVGAGARVVHCLLDGAAGIGADADQTAVFQQQLQQAVGAGADDVAGLQWIAVAVDQCRLLLAVAEAGATDQVGHHGLAGVLPHPLRRDAHHAAGRQDIRIADGVFLLQRRDVGNRAQVLAGDAP
ncbi:hypothetical protein D3C85_1070920 [compost metagenome]